jgi:hypothetical protein
MSTLNVSNITDGTTTVGTSYVVNGSAKAWARYDGASVLADSFNVASTVDGSTTGQTTVNFTNSMSDGNYAAQGTCNGVTGDRFTTISSLTASSYSTLELRSYNTSNAALDRHVSASIHGDLA